MLILTKKKFMFRNADGDAFTTKGGMLIEEAPEWIAKQLLYTLAKDDGDIVEVKGRGEAAETVAVAKATEAVEEPAVEAEVEAEPATVTEAEPAKKEPKAKAAKKETK